MRVARSGGELAALYVDLLSELLTAPNVASVSDPLSIGSAWGTAARDFREMIGLSFAIDTNEVLLRSTSRPLNVEYAIGSSEWILEGRDDLETMNRLNPRGSQFSLDGYTLSGAFGHRLRSLDGDQIESAIQLLASDQSSRRAIAMIGRTHDLEVVTRDFPCATDLQFLVRSERVTTVVHMRSQSFFGVFPYDLVNFRYVQRFVAWRLGRLVGPLVFMCTSAHIYEEEVGRIDAFLGETFEFADPGELTWSSFIAPAG